MSLAHGVTLGPVPYAMALYTCRCGAQALPEPVSAPEPDGWVHVAEDEDLCPRCAERAASRT